jgi:hypothetical protein
MLFFECCLYFLGVFFLDFCSLGFLIFERFFSMGGFFEWLNEDMFVSLLVF